MHSIKEIVEGMVRDEAAPEGYVSVAECVREALKRAKSKAEILAGKGAV